MSDNGETFGRVDQVDPLPSLHALHRQGETDTPRAVQLRAQWLRRDQPASTIATELVHLDDRLVVVKATVTLPTGAATSCHAAEDVGPETPRGAAVERAESRALSGALDRLGYALEPLAEADASETVEASEAPATQDAPPSTPPESEERVSPSPATSPRPVSEPPSGHERWSPSSRATSPSDEGARPHVVDALRRMRRPEGPDVPERPAATPPVERPSATSPAPDRSDRPDSRRPPITLRPRNQPSPAATSASENDEAPLEDFSWSAFWKWARQRGYTSHDELGRAIGRPTQNLTPGQIRAALRDAGATED